MSIYNKLTSLMFVHPANGGSLVHRDGRLNVPWPLITSGGADLFLCEGVLPSKRAINIRKIIRNQSLQDAAVVFIKTKHSISRREHKIA